MASNVYKIIFTGELLDGADIESVKQNLCKLFKMPIERVEALFQAKQTVIKRDLDRETADKYKEALARAGANCRIEPLEADINRETAATELSLTPPLTPVLSEDERQDFMPLDVDTSYMSLAPNDSDLTENDAPPIPEVEAGDYGLAPLGAELDQNPR